MHGFEYNSNSRLRGGISEAWSSEFWFFCRYVINAVRLRHRCRAGLYGVLLLAVALRCGGVPRQSCWHLLRGVLWLRLWGVVALSFLRGQGLRIGTPWGLRGSTGGLREKGACKTTWRHGITRNAFRITGPLWRENLLFTWGFPAQRASSEELWCIWTCCCTNNRVTGVLRHNGAQLMSLVPWTLFSEMSQEVPNACYPLVPMSRENDLSQWKKTTLLLCNGFSHWPRSFSRNPRPQRW